MKSTSKYTLSHGSQIFPLCYKKNETVAQSRVEDKIVAATSAIIHTLCVRKIFPDFNMEKRVNTVVHVDNQDAIPICHNPVVYKKTKQFNLNLFFLSDVQKKRRVIWFSTNRRSASRCI